MNYSLEELAKKIQTEYQKAGELSEQLQANMKEVAENVQQSNVEKFAETLLPVYLEILNGEAVMQECPRNQVRVLVLEVLSKIIPTVNSFRNFEKTFTVLLDVMERDNEYNAILCAKLLSDILKSTSHHFHFEQSLKPLFNFLTQKSQSFYDKVQDICQNPNNQANYLVTGTVQPIKFIRSSDSIKVELFLQGNITKQIITEIPNLFVYACHFVEPYNDFVKNCLKNAVNNFINSLKQMPYLDLAKKAPKLYFSDMISTVAKLFHFITLILRQQISNDKIKEHLSAQSENLKLRADDIAEAVISFFKNVHDDFTPQRIELISYMRFHVKYLGADKFRPYLNDLLEEDVIFGRHKFKSIYGRNIIYQHWLETMQYLVGEMNHHQISKTFEIISKNIYDNNLYNNIQYHSLILHQKIMEVHFLSKRPSEETIQKVIATKFLQKLILKFKQIEEKIVEINKYIAEKYPNYEGPEKNPILTTNFPKKGDILQNEDEKDWMNKKLDFIETNSPNIDSYLFSQSWIHYKTLNVYEDEDELIANCWTIDPTTVNEYLKEIKDKIVPALFDSIRCVTDYIASTNNQIFTQPGQMRPPFKLSEEECYLLGKLLKYGLACMDLLHNYKNPSEDREKLLSFFIIFVGLQDKKNIKDIFETNFKSLFDITLKYSKNGTEESIQNLLTPLIDSPKAYAKSTTYLKQYGSQIQHNWKVFAEILTRQLTLKIENSPEELHQFHPYYEYASDYHTIIHKLIKLCFRCLNRYEQDEFMEPMFKQIIMVLFKKMHSSKFSIEYILLLRNLFKNIMLYPKADNLFLRFQQLCEPNLNVIKNFVALYEAGLSEMSDVLSELILMIPLRTKQLLTVSKILIKPIVTALNLTDHNFLKKGIKTLDIILSNYQNEELDSLLMPVKNELIGKLFYFISNCQEVEVLYGTTKLLGKLGHYPRTQKIKYTIKPINRSDLPIDLRVLDKDGNVEATIPLIESIHLAIDLIEQFFDNKLLVQIKIGDVENSWLFLQSVLSKIICKQVNLDELNYAIETFKTNKDGVQVNQGSYDIVGEILKTLLTVASYAKLKEMEEMFQNICNMSLVSYLMNPDKEDPATLVFLNALIDNLKHKIIYVRGNQNDAYYNTSLSLVKMIIEKAREIIKNDEADIKLYHIIIERLLKVCHNKELTNCNGAINCLIALSTVFGAQYYNAHFFEIIETVFNVIQKIPEVIPFNMFDNCLSLLKIIATFYFESNRENPNLYTICDSLVNQLLSPNENQHEAAKYFLKEISNLFDIKLPLIFFEPEKGPSIIGNQKFEGEGQLNFNRQDLRNENLPIARILSIQEKIFSELSTEKIQKDTQMRYLKTLRNCVETMTMLVDHKILPFKFVDEKDQVFTPDFKAIIANFEKLIDENDKIYKPYVYIISQNVAQQGKDQMEEERKDPTMAQPQPAPSQTPNYIINKNIYYDDEEFNVNIEDVDLTIKCWSRVISSYLNLMRNLMTHKTIHTVIKARVARRNETTGPSAEINETRNKIIFKFFDMMLRIERGIRKSASRGLRTLIRLENQPKDLLTEDKLKIILRPILICLQQDYYKFNIPFLKVLKKLVKYLSQCFNKTLSEKLVEHLNKFMEFLMTGNRRPSSLDIQVDERKIASGIFYLFEHLTHANQHIDGLIKMNNKIDNIIVQMSGMGCMSYLMRKPLLRIVNCFSSGSVEVFLQYLNDLWKLFLYVLKDESSHPIRERLTRETLSFFERTFHDQVLVTSFESTLINQYAEKCIRIVRVISKRNPQWLNKSSVMMPLIKYWNQKDFKKIMDDDFQKEHLRDETTQLLKIFVQYCKQNKEDINLIFDILPIFNFRHSADFSFIHNFYRYYIPEHYSNDQKKTIFLHFLQFIRRNDVAIETKANASYILIYPVMLKCFKAGQGKEVFTAQVLDQVYGLISDSVKKKQQEFGRLEIEILQICGLIITYLKDDFMNEEGAEKERKINLLKLGWLLMKTDDKVYANIAKLFICKFISKAGLPFDQIMQLYVSLLKGQEYINSHDNDIKLLSRKALDILIPYLPNVRPQDDNPNQAPKWISWTCRVFNEENWSDFQGYSFARFWQVFIRMHKIFARYKSFFFTQMINSMQYLVLPIQQTSMYKKIAIDLALIYIEWQYQDMKEKLEKETTSEGKVQVLNQPPMDQNKDIKDIFVNFFIKIAIMSCQEKEEKENITKKAIFLLRKWLIISPNTQIKYNAIEKFLNALQGSLQSGFYREGFDKNKACFTILKIISTLIEFDNVENIRSNMDLIYRLLTHPTSNCFTCDNPYIIQLISNLNKRLLYLNVTSYQTRILELIESGVNAYIRAYRNRTSQQPDALKNLNITIYTTIRTAKVILDYRPDELDTFYQHFLEISKIFIELFDKRTPITNPQTRKPADEDEDLLANIDSHYTEEGFENHKFNFSNLREFLIILIRILSQKLPKFALNQESPEKKSMIELLDNIMEKLPDIDLTMEVLSILNSLLLADHYTEIKSHIPPIKGCFTTKDKITYFLDPKKVTAILEKHHTMRHHDGERVMKKYSKLLIDLLRVIPLSEIEMERLRRLILILNKYVPMNLSNSLYEIIDTHFGSSFPKKLMFFLMEYAEDQYPEETDPDDDLVSTLVNYLIFMVPKEYKVQEQIANIPILEVAERSMDGKKDMVEENPALDESLTKLKGFMEHLELQTAQKLFMRFRKLLTVDYNAKREVLRFYLKELFAVVWHRLIRTDQQIVTQTIENYLLSRNDNITANALLYTIENIYPSFRLKPEVIQHLAKKSNTWNISLFMLEKNIENPQEEEEFDASIMALVELYTRLDAKDLIYGTKRLITQTEELKNGLTLSQHRQWVKAGKIFSSYIEQTTYDPGNAMDVLDKRLSEESWINVHKQLNDWVTIQSVLKGLDQNDLQLELAWQMKDKKLLEKFIQTSDNYNADSSMIQAIVRLTMNAENPRTDDQMFKKTEESLSASLYCSILEWNALPKVMTSSHRNILVRLQSLIEIEETNSMIMKIKDRDHIESNIKEHFIHQLVNHMDIWKSRMPAKYEDLVIWKTILDQRNYLYNQIKRRLELLLMPTTQPQGQQANPSHDTISEMEKKISYFSDIIWNNLKYASMERKFDFYGLARSGKPQFWEVGPQTPGEIFLAMKEQILYRLNCNFDLDNALKIASNALNHEMLGIEHKSEIHRLKVLIHQQAGRLEDANNECVEAIKLNEQNWKCWHTWALYCFKNFVNTKGPKWAEQTIICFLSGVKYKPHKTRLLLADIFWMLTLDDRQRSVQRAFDKLFEELPTWIWILWIPQLVAAIIKNRQESNSSFNILKKIAKDYPQSLYFFLKKFRSIPYHNSFDTMPSNFPEVFDVMKGSQPMLFEGLEFFSDFIININIIQEEKMINEMNTLICSLYLLDSSTQMDRFRLKIFLMLQSFESHIRGIPFNEIIRMQSANLSEILLILKKLIKSIKEKMGSNKVHKIEPIKLLKLQAMMNGLVDIPTLDSTQNEPGLCKQIKVIEVCKEVECIEKSRNLNRILSLRGSNDKIYQYLINNRMTSAQAEPLLPFVTTQLKQILNVKLHSYRETAVRHLELKSLGEFFLSSTVSISEHRSRLKSVNDLLDEHLIRVGKDSDYALEFYLKERDPNANKLEIFKKMDKEIPNDLLKKYALKCCNNMDEYYMFRSNFIATYSMENFFSYLISNELMLENMYIDPAKGYFYYNALKPTFNDQGQLATGYSRQSIRISKNFENFITNMGLEGPFASAFISSSLAFSQYDSDLTTVFYVYIRDCLLKIEHEEVSRRDLTENAEEMLKRIQGLSYSSYEVKFQRRNLIRQRESQDQISNRIYEIITDLTTPITGTQIPKKYKYWF